MTRIIVAMSLVLLAGCVSFGKIQSSRVGLDGGFVDYYLLNQQECPRALVVYLNGSSRSSALGERWMWWWTSITLAYYLQQQLPPKYELMVPEYRNIELGDSQNNAPEVLNHYTLQGRVEAAVSAIEHQLAQNRDRYAKVFLVGHSEGALILSKVYLSLKSREKVKKLVGMSFGGMSQYEQFRILYSSNRNHRGTYIDQLHRLDEAIQKIERDPNSIRKWWLGWPHRRWSDFGPYRPLADLLKIDIPILLMHGSEDKSASVESSRLVAEEFRKANKSNLTYIEYPGYGHEFNGHFDQVSAEVMRWISGETLDAGISN